MTLLKKEIKNTDNIRDYESSGNILYPLKLKKKIATKWSFRALFGLIIVMGTIQLISNFLIPCLLETHQIVFHNVNEMCIYYFWFVLDTIHMKRHFSLCTQHFIHSYFMTHLSALVYWLLLWSLRQSVICLLWIQALMCIQDCFSTLHPDPILIFKNWAALTHCHAVKTPTALWSGLVSPFFSFWGSLFTQMLFFPTKLHHSQLLSSPTISLLPYFLQSPVSSFSNYPHQEWLEIYRNLKFSL